MPAVTVCAVQTSRQLPNVPKEVLDGNHGWFECVGSVPVGHLVGLTWRDVVELVRHVHWVLP